MALYKTPEADLKRNYSLYMQIGAVIALGLLVLAFTVPLERGDTLEVIEDDQEIIEMEEILQTQQIEPPPPPPPAPPPPQEVPDDAVIEDVIEDIEFDLDDDFTAPVAPPPPAPGPPPPPPPADEPAPPPPPPEPEPEEPEIFEVVEQDPELIGGLDGLQSRVEYPEFARRAGIEGTVYVQFVVDEQGRVSEARAVRGNEQLAQSAVKAVAESQFRPGMQRGRPVKVRYTLPVRFVLR